MLSVVCSVVWQWLTYMMSVIAYGLEMFVPTLILHIATYTISGLDGHALSVLLRSYLPQLGEFITLPCYPPFDDM